TRTLTMTLEGLVQKIGLAVIPAFTNGLKSATAVIADAFRFLSEHAPDIVQALEAVTAAAIAYTIKVGLAAAAQVSFNGAAAGGAALGALTRLTTLFTTAIGKATEALKGWTLAEGAATLGISLIAVETYKLIDNLRKLHILKKEAAADDAAAAARDQEAVANRARMVQEVEKVTGATLAGADADAKFAAAEEAMGRMSATQLLAFNRLEAAYVKQRDAKAKAVE